MLGKSDPSCRLSAPLAGPPQVDFSRFPQLINLNTWIVEGSCVHAFLRGLLCIRLPGEQLLTCPVLSRLCMMELMIGGDTIKEIIHLYRIDGKWEMKESCPK